MGRGLEVVTAFATAPGAAGTTAVTLAAGNSLTVRLGVPGKRIELLSLWAFNNVAGFNELRSPLLHDNVHNIRVRVPATLTVPLLPPSPNQLLMPNDILTLLIAGSGVAGNIETTSLLLWYEDLPGADARLIDIAELHRRTRNITTEEVNIVTGAGGGYTGSSAINKTFDTLKANTDYAVLGAVVDTRAATVRIQGADSGNLGQGIPCEPALQDITARWFVFLSERTGLPTIPVYNMTNKGAILVDVAQNQGAAAVNVDIVFAELVPPSAAPPRPA